MQIIQHKISDQTCSICFGDGNPTVVKIGCLTVSTRYCALNAKEAREFADKLYYSPIELLREPIFH